MIGRRLDPHAMLCREFGHPLDPFLADDGFSECLWCGAASYDPLPRLWFPLRLLWETAWVARYVAATLARPFSPAVTRADDGIPF